MENNNQQFKCEQHKGKNIITFCYNKECEQVVPSCITCILKIHNKCDENKIIGIAEMKSKVVINNLQEELNQLKQDLRISIKNQKDAFLKRLENWEIQMLKICDQITYSDLINPIGSSIAKRHYDIKYITESKKLFFTPILKTYTQQQIEEGLKEFNKDLKIAFDSGANQITGGSIAVKKPEIFENWIQSYGSDKIILVLFWKY